MQALTDPFVMSFKFTTCYYLLPSKRSKCASAHGNQWKWIQSNICSCNSIKHIYKKTTPWNCFLVYRGPPAGGTLACTRTQLALLDKEEDRRRTSRGLKNDTRSLTVTVATEFDGSAAVFGLQLTTPIIKLPQMQEVIRHQQTNNLSKYSPWTPCWHGAVFYLSWHSEKKKHLSTQKKTTKKPHDVWSERKLQPLLSLRRFLVLQGADLRAVKASWTM